MELRGKGMNWVNEGVLLKTRQKDKNTRWKEKCVQVAKVKKIKIISP